MNSGLSFLIAARRCEIEELDRLARTCELVGVVARLVHALQRERGLSNVFLASGGRRGAAPRAEQVGQCEQIEQEVRRGFERLEAERPQAANGARLFSRIAWVLPGLDALPDLRRRIGALELTPARSTAAFVKLVAGLLAVVFEAADGATDPEISRRLVALFNFMQGKEFAGRERAFGAAAFISGSIDAERRQQWLHLIESQERCFELFRDCSEAPMVALWQGSQSPAALAERERLRRIGTVASPGSALQAADADAWFDCCSQCIDAMKQVEERLALELREHCAHKMTEAQQELQSYRRLLSALARQSARDKGQAEASADPSAFFDDSAVEPEPAGYGRRLERSILDMVREQGRRLQAMGEELDTVRAALNERKLVERAKGVLMAHRGIAEDEAHKLLRQTAMNQNRRLVDVAASVLTMADLLPARATGSSAS